MNAPGAGLAIKEQLSPEEAKAFGAQMRGRILSLRQGQAHGTIRRPATTNVRKGGAQPPEPPPLGDDDFPHF